MEVRIEERTPVRVAFVRHVGPYQDCNVAWEKLTKFVAGHPSFFSPDALAIGIGHDNPNVTPAEKLRYDACLPVDDEFQATEDIGVQEIPGGEYAAVTVRGPYSGLAMAYRWLFEEWLPTSGRQLRTAPCFEVYVTDPRTTPQEDAMTEIYLPLAG